ncbi:MAG TPA: SPFH domain-containing protein, partial [Terriglobia bacterium]|nr:SPFH domain-containing protein [Terriglobia bacterium]
MSIFGDKIGGELVDIVQWTDDTSNTLVYCFERYKNQLKYGARLTVREGQAAVFVNEGRIADVFEPGMYTLETRNLPVLSTILGWKYGFNSPFLAEVYFCSTRQFTDLKWGTMNPVIMRDAEFGAVRLRAFG